MSGMRDEIRRGLMAFVACVLAAAVQAFPDIPRASADALGVTRGKPFEEGVVFVNGKYLPPPYTVERWGTGIRINRRKVSGQIIDWTEFLKTQSGVKVSSTSSVPSNEPAKPVELAPEPENDETTSSLDDLFDDNGGSSKKPKSRKPRRKAAAKPKVETSYSLDGDFVMNDAAKAMVAKINATRSEIDRTLRMGGFVCFGDGYARVTGDARTAERMLETIPDLMQRCETAKAFATAIGEAHLVFLSGQLCEDLYRNRIDYRMLRERSEQMRREKEWKRTLNKSGIPSY